MFETLDYGIREGEKVRFRSIGPASDDASLAGADLLGRGGEVPAGLTGRVEELRRGWTTLGQRTRGGVVVIKMDIEPPRTYVLDEAELVPVEDPCRVPEASDIAFWRRQDREIEERHPELCVDVVMVRDARQRREYEELKETAVSVVPRLEARVRATARTAERVGRPRFVKRWLERRLRRYEETLLATRRILSQAEAAQDTMAAADRAEAELAGRGRASGGRPL